MTFPERWAIRHKETGHFIPEGYITHNDPTPNCWPILYPSEMSAKRALDRWAEGKWRQSVTRDYYGEVDVDWGPEKVEGRNKADLEVVRVYLRALPARESQ